MYDSHEALIGVAGGNPLQIPRNFASSQTNRFNRYGYNSNRYPFQSLSLTFDTEAERIWFHGGNIQGSYFYNSYPSFLNSYLIVSVAGRIFSIQIKGQEGIVKTIFTGNDPTLHHAWFTQGFEWLVIQNGLDKPIVWDGKTAARRTGQDEVPVGRMMAVIHGRLVVASADGTNQIAVGDIVYGEDQTSTADILKFTEIQYWAEGGAFGAPVYVGDVTGLYAMPFLDTGTGQNELVILGTEGAVSLDLSRPRTEWLNSSILRISLIGGGCVSSHSLAALNGDLLFRSGEGIRSYKNARGEFQQSWKQTPISSDVRRYIDSDAQDLLQFNSQVSWNNLLFSTCRPVIEGSNNPLAGWHRFHKGIVVMDAQPESNTVRDGAPIWYGLWTGIRPVCMVEGRIESDHRCFAFSYDRDGKNRLYEIRKNGFDRFEGVTKKMVSSYDTSVFGTIERTTDNFSLKQIKGGELELSKLEERVDLQLSVRQDNSPCFLKHYEAAVGCDCKVTPCYHSQPPTQARITFGGVDEPCDPSTQTKLKDAHHWQARLRMVGNSRVETLAYRFEMAPNGNPTTCGVVGGKCDPIDCCADADLYEYSLAPEGVNTEIPNIPQPSDVPLVYTGVFTFTANCIFPSTGSPVTVTATESSFISQGDADLKALNSAKAQAFSQLQCTTCYPQVLVSFTLMDESVDLSAFFTAQFESLASRTWRLIDQETLLLYASGNLDAQGNFVITQWQSTGDTTFDPITFVLTDASGTVVPVAFQVSCPGPGGGWPDISTYNPST